ncbi:MAG TPA: helix-turn-helix transcriptional regulator [Micromonosporaceae bacterium]|nr:helix-turn-helix transcriptional regulator [Micromonosporaceae bacterium]
MRVVIGVDGSGRTHRLAQLAAATGGPVLRVPTTCESADDLAGQLVAADQQSRVVHVDDAHRLGAVLLQALTAAARRGIPMVVARRPTIDRPDLAELDEAVATRGEVEILRPLDQDQMAQLVSMVLGRPAPPATVEAVLAASAGLPAVAAAVAAVPAGTVAPALVARLQRRFALLGPQIADLARVLALQLDLTDDLLAAATGQTTAALAEMMRSLRDEGLLVPEGDRMIPAVADAVLAELPPAQRRRIHDTVAKAMIASNTDPVAAATQLRAARIFTVQAAELYLATGERLRFINPTAAASWFDDAAEGGITPARLVAGRTEVAALLGVPVDMDHTSAHPDDAARVALVAGAVAVHDGRSGRAADALLDAGPPGPVLAVPALLATGRVDEAHAALDGPAPLGLRRIAEAVQAIGNPGVCLPLLIEAAETVERVPPELVLPDTPHALGAIVAVTAGDVRIAEYLLNRALAAGTGGPVAVDRHRLLLAWARLRAGRYDSAVDELRRQRHAELPGRERLLLAALAAGIARRSGDIATLRQSWASAEQCLARRTADLLQLEAVEELVVAAARLGQHQRIIPILDTLDEIINRLGRPAAWVTALGWIRLQVAIVDDNVPAAESVMKELLAVTSGPRQHAQAVAARCWVDILANQVDPTAVLDATSWLANADLPWEASRLAGQAAIRVSDADTARRLLERARDLSSGLAIGADTKHHGLSDREVEVARLVLAGRTHREIGAQLYLSPKTVEHHVARIRGKLNATSRAEMLAALREVLDDAVAGPPSPCNPLPPTAPLTAPGN